jgi:hypothetical protein
MDPGKDFENGGEPVTATGKNTLRVKMLKSLPTCAQESGPPHQGLAIPIYGNVIFSYSESPRAALILKRDSPGAP